MYSRAQEALMGVTQNLKWGMLAALVAMLTLFIAGPASARSDCDKTVCAMTTDEAKGLAAKACGWKTLAKADCKCLDTGGMCGGTLTGKNKGYHRCQCSKAPQSQTKPDAKPKSRCFENARSVHRLEGELAGKAAALRCVGIPVDPAHLKTLLGPKPGILRLSVSQKFSERTALRLEFDGAASVSVIPGVVMLQVDPHVNRVKVASGGRGFRLGELLPPKPTPPAKAEPKAKPAPVKSPTPKTVTPPKAK